ncbi:hypothetical protein SPD48_01370 [Pseudogracilibacillus sp. SE30717A]
MKTVAGGFVKWIVSYLAVVFALMLMPVFLITKDVSAFEGIMNYLFNNNS